MRDKSNNKTKAWEYYEKGRAYNNSLTPNQYKTVNTNIEFFAGNQWLHIPQTAAMSRLAKPVFNIIKRVTSLFVASLTSSAATIDFEPLTYYDGENLNDPETNAAVYATAEVRNLLEKFKIDYKIRDALFDGAQTGDYCAHFYWDPDALPYGGAFGAHRGEIQMELVDGINVMFGNPNTTDVESQPYILVIGRDTVENLKWEAERFRKNKARYGKGGSANKHDGDDIQPDAEWQFQGGVGGRVEISPDDDKTGKALYVYCYTKVTTEETVFDEETGLPKQEEVLDSEGNPVPETDEDGRPILDMEGNPRNKTRDMKRLKTSVHVTKATRGANIFEDVDTGLTRYPIAWGVWERQKNQYHGRALVTGIVPNQIFINSMMAMVFRHLQLQSFPKTVYNADVISQWSNEVGVAIGVRNLQPGMSLREVATVLQPADMSNQIVMAIDKVMEYTRECLGATDAQMGRVQPDNTSALMVLQSSAEVPLENIRANLYSWLEDIGKILLDMMGTYYGERPLVREMEFTETVDDGSGTPVLDPYTGQMKTQVVTRRIMEEWDFSQLKDLWLNVAVNAGATTYYSEIAMVQTLDNLRREGTLETLEYLERVPDKLIPRKQELIESIKKRLMEAQQQENAMVESGAQPPAPAAKPKKSSGGSSMGGPLESAKNVANMPTSIQEKYASLPTKAQNALQKQASL